MKERIQQLKIDFEKLETVSEIFNGLHPTIIWFSDTESKYETSFVNFEEKVIWLNGAWYAFQEQQKRIDSLSKHLNKFMELAVDDMGEIYA